MANDTFNYWLPILGELLPCSLLEQVKKKDSDYETVQDILTEYELIVDSYEQARERPGDNEEQKKYYSGKKANHTILDFGLGKKNRRSGRGEAKDGGKQINPSSKSKI